MTCSPSPTKFHDRPTAVHTNFHTLHGRIKSSSMSNVSRTIVQSKENHSNVHKCPSRVNRQHTTVKGNEVFQVSTLWADAKDINQCLH